MFGPRMLLGAVVGGALVYFLDPENGARRRERLREWWEQNQATVNERSARMGEVVNEKVSELSARVRREAPVDEVPTPT